MTGSAPKFGVVLLLAVLLQTVLVTVTVLHFNTSLNQLKETFSRSSVSCLNGWDQQSVSAARDDPCWQVTQLLRQLIDKSMSQHYQKQISSAVRDEVSRVLPSLVAADDGASPRPKVAAHVTGSFAPKLEGGAVSAGAKAGARPVYGQKILWWEGEKGLAFLQDMQLVDGELVVPRPGIYYVYAQTYFRHARPLDQDALEGGGGGGDDDDDRGRPLLQYIYKKMSTYPDPILLMKTSRTSCWSRDSEFSLYSAHQGGLFFLNRGDRLFVTVTNASVVDMDEKSSFFGVFLIS
ncbi:tumor necrosis factor ligand superfamily member 10 isoform X2 [Vanacampus margaritifer]